MSQATIRAEGLSKTYWIPSPDAPAFRDYVARPRWAMRHPRRMAVNVLRELSFEVQEGEVFGIIGRNGAGKSTLLKILSRITTPTAGRARIAGRIASLLEVGTGFHPELTGRENVYLNGMLLGMSSAEVDRAFDSICDFAGVGPYIDVPIKRYSSGMQLRLAFAVAAHLAADTMIIDEVLAVGDAEFQRKCLGAMRDVSRAGRTTLFVSHNLAAVESLCTRVMWLDGGRIRSLGSPEAVVREYLASGVAELEGQARIDIAKHARGWTLGGARLQAIRFERREGSLERRPWRVAFGEPFSVALEFELERPQPDLCLGIGIRNDRGEDILTSHSGDMGPLSLPQGLRSAEGLVHVSAPWLLPGTYFVEVALLSGFQVVDLVHEAAQLTVEEQAHPGAPLPARKKGIVAPIWEWSIT